jgi:pimeloyl-ACP methyl ester carboxylesterase
MPYLNRDGVRIYYEVHGSGSTPLILSHGYSSTSGMWAQQVPALSKDFTLIIWDFRGHGQSDYPPDQSLYSENHTVADIKALLDHVSPGRKAIVGGLSLGGYMSLAFHRVHPERVKALLIIDTGPGFKKDSSREAWNKTANQTAANFDKNGLTPLQNASAERSQVTHRNAKGLALAARGMLAQQNSNVFYSLDSIKVPSLIIVGADDKPFLAATEYMTKKIAGSEKRVIPNAGHAANIDQPQGFLDALMPFLKKVETGQAKL